MPISRSAWMAKARGETTSLWNGSGGRSNMKRYICAPMTVCPPHGEACADIWSSTTRGDRIHHWTGKHPIRHISTRRDQSQSRHNRAGNPLTKRLDTVQTNRTTSSLSAIRPNRHSVSWSFSSRLLSMRPIYRTSIAIGERPPQSHHVWRCEGWVHINVPELEALWEGLVFPTSIWSIVCPYCSMSVSHLPTLTVSCGKGGVSIILLFRHHCPDRAGGFVCQGDGDQHPGLAPQHLLQPGPFGRAVLDRPSDPRHCADDQQSANVPLSHL